MGDRAGDGMNTGMDTGTDSGKLSGFRLHRFEVLNWGTFHKQIWSLPPDGRNSLLTGDIGSGKSTLVDGLTTLLIAPRKIVYNKAAGADARERSLRSYVRGYYKSAKDSGTLSAKSVALRDADSFSVLLAQFANNDYGKVVTLAQVFWSRDHQAPPERFYVLADRALAIAKAFNRFGSDVLELKKRLRKQKGIRLFDSFSQYATAFQRLLGIGNPQAMALFYQTVSMKSVGNLTDFVRHHMLEAPPVIEQIEKICRQFDDLNRAHEAVLKARHQVEALTPIAEAAQRFQNLETRIAQLVENRQALQSFFAGHKIALLNTRLSNVKQMLAKINARLAAGELLVENLRERRRQLERAINESGGRRLEELTETIDRLGEQRRRVADKAQSYQRYRRILKLSAPIDEAVFEANRDQAVDRKKKINAQRDDLHNEKVEQGVNLKKLDEEMSGLAAELKSLKARRTNIPHRNLAIRRSLCEALRIAEADLPFIGELLQIKPEAKIWEGAAERLLHNFGLSLLVPPDRYAAVSAYVNKSHLAGRLVYFKTGAAEGRAVDRPADDRSLLHKLAIKPKNPFFDWLERELQRRFSYTCCESDKAFRRHKTALTAAGQIKTGGIRHEKDDRFRIDDRSRFVLGWHNKDKIRTLEAHLQAFKKQRGEVLNQLQELDVRRKSIAATGDLLQSILSFETFAEIDWQPLAQRIQALQTEKQRLEESSDILKTLQDQLDRLKDEINTEAGKVDKLRGQQGRLQERTAQYQRLRAESGRFLKEIPLKDRRRQFPILRELLPDALGDTQLTVENCDANQRRMRGWLQRKIENEQEKSKRLTQQIVRRMQAYKDRYAVETREVDASVDAAPEFMAMLDTLKQEDLPRHEARFKKMLNEGTIQNIALFRAKLDSELHSIREKIETINGSLSAIDYNDGTYISLAADSSRDVEIRHFQEELRLCLGDTLAGDQDQAYTENKFLQVKAIIDRFNGREGQADLDRRWTGKVTDVRNWLIFSVAERWREDNAEKEFYSDTAGKSGGQKEKLAYTILASALVYQFGLKWGERRSKSFRFVMIDEAFGRGSDESTRYALELFERLNLQLLIVTPLQKINIIEDYVDAVHYIHNPDGQNSMIRNLTIEQYREERVQYQEAAA